MVHESCGHRYSGLYRESICLPCLDYDCTHYNEYLNVKKAKVKQKNQYRHRKLMYEKTDYCKICSLDKLGDYPCV